MQKIKAGIIGATGYAGAELVRLLLTHPNVEIAGVSSVSYTGQALDDIYPNLHSFISMRLKSAEEIVSDCDVVFASLPHGLSEPLARQCLDADTLLIDLGADFRLHNPDDYSQWYGKTYTEPELHDRAIYALPELFREDIRQAAIIGNPGCYPTSVALGLAPALKEKLISPEHIIIDSKSGVTGAGRGLTQNTHYPDTNEAFSAYKAAAHRHTPEIEQTLSIVAGEKVNVTFVPHLLPVNRGIESTIYAKLTPGVTAEALRDAYARAYADEFFVRLLPEGAYANIKNVRMSNFCDISLHIDVRTGTAIICTCIDNMVKGAAGQAIQNMNIRFGLPETAGLIHVPPAF